MKALIWSGFKESSNAQLIPIRQLELFRDRTKIANDEGIPEAEKKAKLTDIDAKLDALAKQSGS